MTKTYLEALLDSLEAFPDEELAHDQGDELYLRNWGFTVYRTAYGPDSQRKRDTLMETINAQARDQIMKSQATENDPPNRLEKAPSLYRMDYRSDKGSLEGKTQDELRQYYKNGVGVAPMNRRFHWHRLFLVVDNEVLETGAGTGQPWIKCVDADYDPEDYMPKGRLRYRSQAYFGWMKITTRSLADLWVEQLSIWGLDSVVHTGHAHHENVWDSYLSVKSPA